MSSDAGNPKGQLERQRALRPKDEGPSGATSGPLEFGPLSKDVREPVQGHKGPNRKTP